jgi:hypothetical protein
MICFTLQIIYIHFTDDELVDYIYTHICMSPGKFSTPCDELAYVIKFKRYWACTVYIVGPIKIFVDFFFFFCGSTHLKVIKTS